MKRIVTVIGLILLNLPPVSTHAGSMLPCTSLGAAVCGSGACPIGEACLATGDDVIACDCFAASTTTTTVSVTTTTATFSTLPPVPPGECACDPGAPPNFDRMIRAALDGEAHAILYRGIGTSPVVKDLGRIAKGFQKVGTLMRKTRSAAMLAQLPESFAAKQEIKAAKILARAQKATDQLGEKITTAASAGNIDPTAAAGLLGIHGLLLGDLGGVSVSSDCFDKLAPSCGSGSCNTGTCKAFGSLGACLCQ